MAKSVTLSLALGPAAVLAALIWQIPVVPRGWVLVVVLALLLVAARVPIEPEQAAEVETRMTTPLPWKRRGVPERWVNGVVLGMGCVLVTDRLDVPIGGLKWVGTGLSVALALLVGHYTEHK